MELLKKKRTWIALLGAIVIIIVAVNFSTILATFSYVSQETELAESDYSVNSNELTIILSDIPDLASVGGAVTIVDASLPSYILIARVNTDGYLVVSSECTHRGHALDYIHEDSIIKCSSLGGETFDLEGNYINGPSSEDLPTYDFYLDSGMLIIDLSSYN
jgi:Rieske Fe-S protein